MRRHVRLQWPLSGVGSVHVRPIPGTTDAAIAAATGLQLDQIARLYFDDRDAILREMTR